MDNSKQTYSDGWTDGWARFGSMAPIPTVMPDLSKGSKTEYIRGYTEGFECHRMVKESRNYYKENAEDV